MLYFTPTPITLGYSFSYLGIPAWNHGADLSSFSSRGLIKLSALSGGRGGGGGGGGGGAVVILESDPTLLPDMLCRFKVAILQVLGNVFVSELLQLFSDTWLYGDDVHVVRFLEMPTKIHISLKD